jgi:protein O-GlcNAc transferase
MDVDRFARDLTALFEDFPRSEHPRERRYDDIVRQVPNLAEENTLALVNLAARLLDPGESYVEAGTFMGASLIAAARGNEDKDLVAMDDFSFPAMEVRGRVLPPASRSVLEANLARFGVEDATILEGDALELLRSGALGDRRVGAYYYDASHSYEHQLEGLRLIEPYLTERALLIVDDSDWEDVARATRDYLASQPKARLLLEIGGEAYDQPWWWDGVMVLAWTA